MTDVMVEPPVERTLTRRRVTTARLLGSPRTVTTVEQVRIAFYRALRTLLQGLAGALPAAGAGSAMLSASYWVTVQYSFLAAVITALVSLLQNLAAILPEDPMAAGEVQA